jgi:hypothetical protein
MGVQLFEKTVCLNTLVLSDSAAVTTFIAAEDH